ncbi:MAG: tetratricopeptide repeat protein, partial [Acidobacteriota bacterium]
MRIRTMQLMVFLLVISVLSVTGSAQFETAEPELADVQHYRVSIEVEPDRNYLHGRVQIELDVLRDTRAFSFSFNPQLSIVDVRDEQGERFAIRADDFTRNRVRIEGDESMKQGTRKTLDIEFEGLLEREQYAFLDVPSTQQAVIESSGAVLLSAGYWFPSHRLATDGATAEVSVTVPLGYTVVAPGSLDEIETLGITEAFHWKSERPLNQINVIVSRYFRERFESGPVPITFYVSEDSERDVTAVVEKVSELVNFFQSQYGEVPVDELVLAEVGNVALTSTGAPGIIFLEERVLDAYTLPEFEIARRVAQQWWGFSVRIKTVQDAWLQEGFATYSALQYLKSKDPKLFEDRLAKEAVEALKYQETAPIFSGLDLEMGSPQYRSIVGSKGAWVLYMLGQLMGEAELNQAVVDFYHEKSQQAAAISDFVKLVQGRTTENFNWFFIQWIESVGVPEFRLDYTIFRLREGGFKIRGQVKQNLELFRTPMDLLFETKGQPEEKQLMVNGKTTTFTFETQTMPVRIEIDPHGKILMDSERMRLAVHISLGDEFAEQGEHVSAITEYEQAIAQNARSSLAHFRLGEVFFQQHSYSNAANSMRDVLNGDLKPEWVETWAHIYLGKVYDILGQ